jgi:hypothetical protein
MSRTLEAETIRMAKINELGQVLARCVNCDGGNSRFEYKANDKEIGVVVSKGPKPNSHPWRPEYTDYQYRLFRCVGCGMGAFGVLLMEEENGSFPTQVKDLIHFYPEAKERLPLPKDVPDGIRNEFREAERCLESECYRAAAALFRSVLDKTLKSNGYKSGRKINLEAQIDEAAKDGVITEARKKRAHEDIRVLGNDILHDDWRELSEEDVEPAHRYTQRVLEDLYDDRTSVLKQLREAGRKPSEEGNDADGAPNPAAPADRKASLSGR